MKKTLKIGTRESKLARVQTDLVVEKIKNKFPEIEIEIVGISTKGDQLLERSLSSFGGKGIFTKELEVALYEKRIDLAVHSAKDMPMELPEPFVLGAVIEREEAGDVFVTLCGTPLSKMKAGARIGTGSLRREIQIKEKNPYVEVKEIRGNVQTRLAKLEQGEYDGIILAYAGLKRLGIDSYPQSKYHMEQLLCSKFLPAVGQGILGIECRKDDQEVLEILQEIHSKEGEEILVAERQCAMELASGCNAPVGVYGRKDKETNKIILEGMYAKDGKTPKYVRMEQRVGETGKELGTRLGKALKYGKVFFVGAGPMNDGLLTVAGKERIQKADVILYDHLISTSLLQLTKDTSEWIYVGKRANRHHMPQEKMNELLIQKAKEGKDVVRLKGGDSFVFGRGGEEAIELEKEGIPFEIISGVSSCYSAPAYAGIPVTHREYASSFHVITGHEQVGQKAHHLDYETLAKLGGTLVFLMGIKNIEEISNKLMKYGKDPDTKVAIVSRGTTKKQRKIVGTLKTIVELMKTETNITPACFVVGKVVGLHDKLDFFTPAKEEQRKIVLTGTKEWVSRAKEKMEKEKVKGEIIPFSLIRTQFLEEEIKQVDITEYSWLVFTSGTGVRYFFDYLKKIGKDIRSLYHQKIGVIGTGTEEVLQSYGIQADFVPSEFTSEIFAKEWVSTLKQEDKVLLLRAKEGSQALPDALEKANISYRQCTMYETQVEEKKREEWNRLLTEVDYVVFASGSAVKAAVELQEEQNEDVKCQFLSIGPVTTKVATECGIAIEKTATTYSIDGVIELLKENWGE